MFGRPTRSYAQVEHDADGLGSVAAAPYSLRKEGTFKTYRAPLSEHSRRIDPGHIPHALQSRHARKQAAAEGARAELDQILESGYRPSSRSIHNGSEDQVSPESAGMSRHRTAGGLHAQAESSRMARLRSTASISSFRANGNGGGFGSRDGGGSGKRGVFVDADGRTHDQEYDPFAKHAAESRKKSMSSRRRSAFGGSSTHGHSNGNGGGGGFRDGDSGSETSRSGSDFSDGAASGRYSAGTGAMSGHLGQGLGPARKSIDSYRANAESREEEEIRKRLAMERKRLEGLSGYSALAKRRSVISDRSGQPFAGEGSIRSLADDVDRLTVHSNYAAGQHTQYTAGGRRSVTGYNPSPLSPTFSAGTGRARTNTTSDGGDETPVKSTENTLMPPMSPPQPPSPGTGYFGNGDSNGDRRGSADRSAPVSSNPAYSTKEKSKPLPTEPAPQPKAKVEIKRDGSRKVTGFDAPRSPMPPPPVPAAPANVASGSGTASTHLVQSHIQLQNQQGQMKLDVPASAKSAVSRGSRGSRGSSDRDPREVGDDQSIMSANTSNAAARYRRERPAPRPREEIFPETPAQAKRREEKERRAAARLGPSSASGIGASSGSRGVSSTVIRSSGSNLRAPSAAQAYASSSTGGGMRNHSQLEIDTSLAASTRLLPEIQIVEDDDPRVVIPPTGRSTRVQTVHDHVIRGPFSHALNAQGLSSVAPPSGSGVGAGGMAGIGIGSPTGSARSSRQVSRAGSPSAASVLAGGAAAGARKPSSVNSPFSIGSGTGTVEDRIGYLPSRWASGDKQLRATEEEREMYRPKEWGGRKGELGGRQEDWHPELKDQIKRSWKDVQTNARFSLFRAKKKLGRM